jgi:hypothetical protein
MSSIEIVLKRRDIQVDSSRSGRERTVGQLTCVVDSATVFTAWTVEPGKPSTNARSATGEPGFRIAADTYGITRHLGTKFETPPALFSGQSRVASALGSENVERPSAPYEGDAEAEIAESVSDIATALGLRKPPSLLLTGTGKRSAILIHPGAGFKSSIGCINLSSEELASSITMLDAKDSTSQVLELATLIVGRSRLVWNTTRHSDEFANLTLTVQE